MRRRINPLRNQPDYGQRNIQNQIKQLYKDYLKVSKILNCVYSDSLKVK